MYSFKQKSTQVSYQDYNERKSFEKARRSGRLRKMSDQSEARLKHLVKKKRGKVLRDIATEFNIGNGDHSVSERTDQRYLHKNRIYRRIVKKRMVVKEINSKKRLTWCLQNRRWTVNENWRHIIFSHESLIVIGQNNQVYRS